MKPTIDTIIQELFSLDPTLKDHEKEVRQLLLRMLEAKPDVRIDDRFVSTLRDSLMRRTVAESNRKFDVQRLLFSWKRYSVFGGAIAVASIVLVAGAALYRSERSVSTPLAVFNREPVLVVREKMAFGSLNYLSGAAQGSVQVGAPETRSAIPPGNVGMGGGGGVTKDIAISDSRMIAPYIAYSYTYAGEDFSLPGELLPVYRRTRHMPPVDGVIGAVRSVTDRMFDISSFGPANMQLLTFAQSADDGYAVSINFSNGSAFMEPGNTKWYMPADCVGQICPPVPPLEEEDILSDDTLLTLANDFLSVHGIDASRYGTPFVDTQWKLYQMPTAGESDEKRAASLSYIPDVVSVIYPLIIDGNIVRDTNAVPYGLRVNVDMRKQKVQGLWNLTNDTYDKSDYAIETDKGRIKKIATRGGGYIPEGGTEIALTLGTPTLSYIQHYFAANPYEPPQELYIPALQFPIMNPPASGMYFQQVVTVPLIKDVLDAYDQPVDGPIRIMEDTAEKR